MKVLSIVDLSASARERVRALGPDIELFVGDSNQPGFAEALRAAEVLAGWFSADQLALARNVRWLQLGSAGAERFLDTVPDHVVMTTASGVFGTAIAEHVLAMMLALVRGVDRMLALGNQRRWDRGTGDRVVRGVVSGATLAIFGLGDIGRALALRARALEMRVIGVRHRSELPAPPGVEEVHGESGIDGVLARADHVVLALPATRQTDRLIDARRLGLMRRGAFLYNVGRGNAIDEAALVAAIRSGALGGAGLDVFAMEPLPEDSPLYDLDNVVISPHSAGHAPAYAERFGDMFVANLERYVTGRPLENVVERARGY